MFNTSLGEVFNISAEPPVLFNTSAEPSVLFNTLHEAVGDPKARETAAREADAITNSQLRPTCASRAHHGPPQPRRAQSRAEAARRAAQSRTRRAAHRERERARGGSARRKRPLSRASACCMMSMERTLPILRLIWTLRHDAWVLTIIHKIHRPLLRLKIA